MIRSIRFSLTLWYAGILAVILTLFSLVLYANVRQNLRNDIRLVLTSEAESIGDAVFSFWKTENEDTRHFKNREQAKKDYLKELAGGELSSIVAQWADNSNELETTRAVRVLGMDGRTLAFSQNINQWFLPINSKVLSKASKGLTFFESFQAGDGSRVLMITHPIREGGKPLYIVQIAVSVHQMDVSLARLRLWLFCLIPATLAVTSLVGWFLASLALKPVGKMIGQVERLNEAQLHERIDEPKTGDELQDLAATFNRMMNRVERGYRRLRQFSAATSHELRTPLTVLKGEMEWALRKPRAEDDYRRVLSSQLELVNEMSKVVEQLLSVAHAEGDWTLEWKPVWLRPVLNSVKDLYAKIAAEKKVALELTDSPDVCVYGERSLLERMTANLVENALKHSPPGGQVRMEVGVPNGMACLSIEDTGPGISSDELPKVFDKFFTRKVSIADGQSTGIGLGLCRWIAEAHRGKIEVSSLPGKGSVFTVWLPVK